MAETETEPVAKTPVAPAVEAEPEEVRVFLNRNTKSWLTQAVTLPDPRDESTVLRFDETGIMLDLDTAEKIVKAADAAGFAVEIGN